MAMMDVDSRLYQPSLDLFASCRPAG